MIIEDIKEGIISKEKAIEDFRDNFDYYHLCFNGREVYEYSWDEINNPESELRSFINQKEDEAISEFKRKIKDCNIVSSIEYSDNDG